MTPDPQSQREGRRLLRIHVGAVIVAGVAVGASAGGLIRLAQGAIVLVLLALIVSVETLRVLILSNREPRR